MFPIEQRTSLFRAAAQEAIEAKSGPEALDAITLTYTSDLTALDARLTATETELAAMAAQVQSKDGIVRFLHSSAAHQLLLNARMEGHLQQLRTMVDQVRRLVQDAHANDDGALKGTVETADLEAVLSRPVDVPEFTPQILAFTPVLERDRVGHFSSDDNAVRISYPLVGYSLVVRQEDSLHRRLEPTFMVDEQLLPESALRHTYGLALRRL